MDGNQQEEVFPEAKCLHIKANVLPLCHYAAISCLSLGFCLPLFLFHNYAQVISIKGEGSNDTENYGCFAVSRDPTNTSLAVVA